jgi:dTDP-4-dehydrorhamnose reductase
LQILLTGGSGLLGTELRRLEPHLLAPTREQLDITDAASVKKYVASHSPDLILHAAAMTNNREVEANPEMAQKVNVEGTANLVRACDGTRIRFIYVSTDYVYKGDRGNYSESDEVEPFNLYAKTKLAGEIEVRRVPNHLIIRTSFGASKFDYPEAFIDKWSSKEYVDVIAPKILEAARSPLTGVVNLGGKRRSLYEYAVERNPDVNKIQLRDSHHNSPVDTSLNLSRWDDYVHDRGPVRGVTNCRVCGNAELVKYLDLGMLPLDNEPANSVEEAIDTERFPLQLLYCEDCSLSQLSIVIAADKLVSSRTNDSSKSVSDIRHVRTMSRSPDTKFFSWVDDVNGFLAAARDCLYEEGAVVLECPYAMDIIENRAFHTVDFEQLNYVLVKTLIRLATMQGMEVFNVEKHDSRSDTVRVCLGLEGKQVIESSVGRFVEDEQCGGFHEVDIYRKWGIEIAGLIEDLRRQLGELKKNGAKICAFGASRNSNTILNACRLDRETIDCIVDEAPKNVGKFSPGTGIPIVGRSVLNDARPDYLVLLAWNIADEIIASMTGFDGNFIVPFPAFRIIEPQQGATK